MTNPVRIDQNATAENCRAALRRFARIEKDIRGLLARANAGDAPVEEEARRIRGETRRALESYLDGSPLYRRLLEQENTSRNGGRAG